MTIPLKAVSKSTQTISNLLNYTPRSLSVSQFECVCMCMCVCVCTVCTVCVSTCMPYMDTLSHVGTGYVKF